MRFCSRCQRCYDDQVQFCAEHSDHALSEIRSGSCEIIAGYRLDVLLESGVKGDLFRAHQIEFGRYCRVRVMSPKRKSGHQFLREAKHAAALFHPNLVDIYEAGLLGSGEYFVVTEEPKGQTLREYLKAVGIPPLLSTIQMIEQTAEALHAIHREGLLHRAVRPENIVLTTDEAGQLSIRLKDIDLGGVIERSIITNKFLIDTALDAVRFFAPEQCTAGRVSLQTDIYALGAVLYEMLAGAPPFDAPKASGLIEKHRHQRPAEIRIDNFDLRMLLSHTLSESLQKEPEKRHTTALAFARQLRHMEQLATHVSTPPPAILVPPVQMVPAMAVKPVPPKVELRLVNEPVLPRPATVVPRYRFEPESVVPEVVMHDPWIEPEPVATFEFESDPMPRPVIEIVEPVTNSLPLEEQIVSDAAPRPRPDRALRLARRRIRKNRSQKTVWSDDVKVIPDISEPEPEIGEIAEDRVSEPVEPSEILLSPPQFIQPEEEITAVTARVKPALVEWQQADDDIPSIEAVLDVLSNEHIEPSFDPGNVAASDSPASVGQKRDRSATERDEIQFFPSVMRKSSGNGSLDLYPNYSILSGYEAAQTRFSIDYQTLILGAGLVAILLLFLVGNVMYKQSRAAEALPAPAGTKTVFGELTHSETTPQIAQANPNKKVQKPVQKTKTEMTTDEDVHSPNAATDVRPQKSSNVPTQNQVSKNVSPARNGEKPSSISSTLVISTENGKVRSVVENGKHSTDPRSSSATGKSTVNGRPRVVGNPSQ